MAENFAPDLLLDGRLKLFQRTGHRAGTDAVLLAAAAPALPSGLIVDAGAGAGTVGLLLAQTNPDARVVLLEKNPVAAEDARRNIEANFLAGRARLVEADLFDKAARKAEGLVEAADLVVTNPPFLEARAARVSPDADRAMAHVLGGRGAGPVAKSRARPAASRRVFRVDPSRPRAGRHFWPGLRGAWRSRNFSDFSARRSRGDKGLVRGRKGSKAPLALLPGLVLHGEDGAFTPAAEAVHRGRKLFDQ